MLEIAIVTDVIDPFLERALETAQAWELDRFEVRGTGAGRFPNVSAGDLRALEDARARGGRIVAAAPDVFSHPVEDRARLQPGLARVLPQSLDLAGQLGCGRVRIAGFERYPGEPDANRLLVLRAFEAAAEQADAVGLVLAVENATGYWVDAPLGAASLLAELGHPALRLAWNPAENLRGGHVPNEDDFDAIRAALVDVRARDCSPTGDDAGWKAVGQGRVPWPEIVHWLGTYTDLTGVTLDAPGHAEASLDRLRSFEF